MNNKPCKNIVNYWNAVERFTPHHLDTKNKLGYVEEIQRGILREEDIRWKSREDYSYNKTPKETWVYNVFLGVVNSSDITKLLKTMLANNKEDYNLQSNNNVSYLCTFQLNNYGEILKDTFAIPEYFISIACLNKKNSYPKTWLDLAPKIQQRVEDTYKNWVDVLSNRPNCTVKFEDLKALLTDIIKVSEVSDFHNLIRNHAIIYSSCIPVPNRFKDDKEKGEEKFSDIKYYEEILETITAPDLNILNSFYLDDIKMVNNVLNNDKETIGNALKDYLGLTPKGKKHDLRKDRFQLEQLSNPEFLPSSRWPVDNKLALSIAQQVAVNLALSETSGLFSVNGPPGTGKTTLLRDIISEIITTKAKILADFANPKDAFNNPESISIEGYNYKVWNVDSRLLGHEIVIASSNNTAVENISKEIPRLAEVDKNYGLEYFSEIATYVNNEECWGIGSAVLGNKANRSTFFDKFWSKQPSKNNELGNSYGLHYLLDTAKPKSDWEENRKQFLSTLAEFTELKLELIEFKNKLKEYESFDEEEDKIFNQINKANDELKISQEKLESYENELAQIDTITQQKKFQLEEIKKLEPKWYLMLFEFFKKESSHQKWSDKCLSIIEEISKLFEKTQELKLVIGDLRKVISKLESKVSDLIKKREELIASTERNYQYINLIQNKYSWSSAIPNKNFWQLSDQEIQLSSPWIHTELQDVRARLFVDAMKLHYSFIINSSDCISNNLKAIKRVLTSGKWPSDLQYLLKHIWAVFFLVVPSVSTTFASFSKLFKGLNEAESLGWLLVDEAGQSCPQEALGAIYRAKKAIIVGDPLQVRPVATMPSAMNDTLLEYYHVDKTWSVLEESVQTLSDRVNVYGTEIIKYANSQWVGCPLRVHRRCIEPMFSIANKIAYDNLMIQATKQKSSNFDPIYPTSQWFDVQSNEFNGHWCEQEGTEAFKIIQRIIEQNHSLPDLYIITPFKAVADKLKKLLKDKSEYLNSKLKPTEKPMLTNWIYKSVGTIHAFQGKQSEGVILLLGGNPSKPGAINWASDTPNILNVALTRAKYKFFVIGNYKLWSSKPHFQDLATVIPLTRISNEISDIAEKEEA
ncbi:MAG: ATP-binding protein [Rickettsiaceae bacterium]|nr:ATP-binding protein [Rickettsiaceae bacterium]